MWSPSATSPSFFAQQDSRCTLAKKRLGEDLAKSWQSHWQYFSKRLCAIAHRKGLNRKAWHDLSSLLLDMIWAVCCKLAAFWGPTRKCQLNLLMVFGGPVAKSIMAVVKERILENVAWNLHQNYCIITETIISIKLTLLVSQVTELVTLWSLCHC